ncbi:hypothetical protein [Cupriavidus sp. AU9028]|uniref:hypothetical protein n=1 Tax=Cupriavidus sp. AU9028 TaxID=2871157 RepID=UPI001C93C16D|nr:hypothetical protein [Cupriavidus sp. AU9028]MBY4897529.1 hypothetical protein [Cupriavidus sp. AU9028]
MDESVQVGTGDSVPESGIYLPEVSDAAAQFLIGGHRACPAKTGFNGQQYMSKVPTIWKRVRRIEGETVADGLADLLMTGSKVVPIRAQGGLPCPKEGWWFTPSQAHSRRYFCEGEVFPTIEGSAYGSTFWQWDRDQDEPRLR